jgi:hypothetical protein
MLCCVTQGVAAQSKQSTKLVLQSSELRLPQSLIRRRVCPPPPPPPVLGGGAHSLAREGLGDWESTNSMPTRDIFVVLFICMYFVGCRTYRSVAAPVLRAPIAPVAGQLEMRLCMKKKLMGGGGGGGGSGSGAVVVAAAAAAARWLRGGCVGGGGAAVAAAAARRWRCGGGDRRRWRSLHRRDVQVRFSCRMYLR